MAVQPETLEFYSRHLANYGPLTHERWSQLARLYHIGNAPEAIWSPQWKYPDGDDDGNCVWLPLAYPESLHLAVRRLLNQIAPCPWKQAVAYVSMLACQIHQTGKLSISDGGPRAATPEEKEWAAHSEAYRMAWEIVS